MIKSFLQKLKNARQRAFFFGVCSRSILIILPVMGCRVFYVYLRLLRKLSR